MPILQDNLRKEFTELMGVKIQSMQSLDELLNYLSDIGVITDNKIIYLLVIRDYHRYLNKETEIKSVRKFALETSERYGVSEPTIFNIIYKNQAELRLFLSY